MPPKRKADAPVKPGPKAAAAVAAAPSQAAGGARGGNASNAKRPSRTGRGGRPAAEQPAERDVKRKAQAEPEGPVSKKPRRDPLSGLYPSAAPVVTARQRAILAAAAASEENKRWTDFKWPRPVWPTAPARPRPPRRNASSGGGGAAATAPPAGDADDKDALIVPVALSLPPTPQEVQLTRRLVPADLRTDLVGFAEHLKRCRNVVVCVGAGASVAAGIPDFRTPGKGLYSNQRLRDFNVPRPEDVFNLRYFKRRPDACYSMLGDMWPGNWPPTRVHYFLSLLQRKGMLQRVYTQNIDDLERLAGVPPELLIEAHGTFSRVQCVDCGFTPHVRFVKDALKEGRRPLCPLCTADLPRAPAVDPRKGRDIRVKPAEDVTKLFVYGGLRPDDSSGLEPTSMFFSHGVEFMKGSLRGVKLYHDARPVIRIPDPAATMEDRVRGYLVRFKDEFAVQERMVDLDKREGCPVLAQRATVMVEPDDGGPPVAAYVYHSPTCAHHTEVPYGDWERRREWNALPELPGLIKPNIVFFDEELPDEFCPHRIESDMGAADALIIIGTSLRVTPFSWLPHLVTVHCPRLLLNLNAQEVAVRAGFNLHWHGWRDVAHDGDCQAAITELARHLGWEDELVELKQEGDLRMRAMWKAEAATAPQDDARPQDDADDDAAKVASIDGADWGEVSFGDGCSDDEDDDEEEEEGEEDEEDEDDDDDDDDDEGRA